MDSATLETDKIKTSLSGSTVDATMEKCKMSKQIKMTKRKFKTDDNSNYRLVETEVSEITREQHKMIIEAIPFFRNLGGKEKVVTLWNHSPRSKVVRLTSTSPDRSIKVIRDFDFE